jgi:hypothetical protein
MRISILASFALVVPAVVVALPATPARSAEPAKQAMFNIQLAGEKQVTDTIKSVILQKDRPQVWDLIITGSKGKGQFTCEIRSAHHETLFAIQRHILDYEDQVVTCANAQKSARGGALIDLDDPKGGTLVIQIHRQH